MNNATFNTDHTDYHHVATQRHRRAENSIRNFNHAKTLDRTRLSGFLETTVLIKISDDETEHSSKRWPKSICCCLPII